MHNLVALDQSFQTVCRDTLRTMVRRQLDLKQYLTLVQGRPTRGPSRFEWPAEYFLKLSVPSILAEIEDKFDVKTPFFLFFSSFRDHYDFGTKSGKSETDFKEDLFFY